MFNNNTPVEIWYQQEHTDANGNNMTEYTPDQYAETALLDEAPTSARNPVVIGRRALLGAGIAVSSMAAFNHVLGIVERPLIAAAFDDQPIDIEFLAKYEVTRTAHVNLCSGGWGRESGKSIAERLIDSTVYSQSDPAAFFRLSGNVSNDSLVACGSEFSIVNRPKTIDLQGVSAGGMFGLTAARGIGAPVRMVTMNASPFDIDDAKWGFFAKTIAELHNFGVYDGGLVGQYVSELGKEYNRHDIAALTDYRREAFKNTFDGSSPQVRTSETSFLANAHLWDNRWKYEGIITPDTRAIYMMSDQPDTDQVVKVVQSYEKYQNFFAFFGVPCEVMTYPEPGHALERAGIEAAAEKMRNILAESRPT